MSKRILVTGSHGFVGHHLVRYLLDNTDWEIIGIDSFRHAGDPLRNHDDPGYQVFCHDLNAPIGKRLVEKIGRVNYIINLASNSDVDMSISDPIAIWENNTRLIGNILEYAKTQKCRDLEAFIQCSTDEVFGPAHAGEFHDEWSVICPSNPYCLASGTKVLTPSGLVDIEDFSINRDRTISRFETKTHGLPGTATNKWKFLYKGPVLRIKTHEGGEEIVCSKDHRFFACVNSHAFGGRKMVEKRAEDLRVGDRVSVIRKVRTPADLPIVDLGYARFLGYWIGDGSYSKKSRYVRLADQKRDYIEYYSRLAKDICGISKKSSTGSFGNIYKHKTKDCWYLQFSSETLRGKIDLSDRKNVLAQAVNFPLDATGEFLAGWIDAEGHAKIEDGLLVSASVCSYDENIRIVMKYLFRRFGILAVDDKKWNRLNIVDSDSLSRLVKFCKSRKLSGELRFRNPQKKRGKAKNWIWARIESITEEQYDGVLYDLEVDKYHNYVASYFLVHNSASKAAQEGLCISYWRTYGLPLIITNAMNMVGETQEPVKFIPKIIKCVEAGEPIVIHGTPADIGSRMYLDARNLADGWLFLLNKVHPVGYTEWGESRPDRYNIVGQEEIDNLALAKRIAEIMGKPLKYRFEDFHKTRPGHDRRYALCGDKIEKLGWKHPIPFDETLKRVIKWSVDHPEWLK